MSWQEKTQDTQYSVEGERLELLNKVKTETLPTIQKEADGGMRGFDPLKFQPVISRDLFEGEFALKNDDLIFHFWPYGYHQADAAQKRLPKFKAGFLDSLTTAMTAVFSTKAVIEMDEDMGAYFVKVSGGGTSIFHRDQCIKACQILHQQLGGES